MKATVHRVGAAAGEHNSDFFGLALPAGATHVAVVKGAPDRLLPFVDGWDDEGNGGGLGAQLRARIYRYCLCRRAKYGRASG